mmetsp:Transcript_36873/g.61063  ORF Transcript_36873/g.61063 Transcript_36873/m.61063 type:complete len:441 (+) Transcript_36873:21-1343(+)
MFAVWQPVERKEPLEECKEPLEDCNGPVEESSKGPEAKSDLRCWRCSDISIALAVIATLGATAVLVGGIFLGILIACSTIGSCLPVALDAAGTSGLQLHTHESTRPPPSSALRPTSGTEATDLRPLGRPPPPCPSPPPPTPSSQPPCCSPPVQQHRSPQFLGSQPPALVPPKPQPPQPNCPHPSPSPTVPPTPPSPHPAVLLAASLGERFAAGKPTPDLERAGILIHQLDGMGSSDSSWLPCPEPWCADRLSATLINKQVPYLYSSTARGIVINSTRVSVLCSFSFDGGTDQRICSPPGSSPMCLPGCYRQKNSGAGDDWCDFRKTYDLGFCAWHPEWLQGMMRQQLVGLVAREGLTACGKPQCLYNEVVLDGQAWLAQLPEAVEAFFVPTGAPPSEERAARDARRAFLSRFHVSASNVPMMRLNVASQNAEQIFQAIFD